MSNQFFQFARVVISIGEGHHHNIYKFIPCGEKGLTEEDKFNYLQENHWANDEANSEGLSEGFFWCMDDNAAGLFPVNRDNDWSMEIPIYAADGEYMANIKKFAKELIGE